MVRSAYGPAQDHHRKVAGKLRPNARKPEEGNSKGIQKMPNITRELTKIIN